MSAGDKTPAAVVKLLDGFFGEANRLKLAAIDDPKDKAAKFRFAVDRLRRPEPLPTVLPRWREDNSMELYGIARSEEELRSLAEKLLAFVGPSYSTFRGEWAELDPHDPVDVAVHDYTSGLALRFRFASGREEFRRAWARIVLMDAVEAKRRWRSMVDLRSPGRVLRDFYMALLGRDRDTAERALGELRGHHDPVNLLFLRVQLLSELGAPEELLALPQLGDLLGARHPRAVSEALARAVYAVELASFEAKKDASGAIEHFARRVGPLYGTLLENCGGTRDGSVLKGLVVKTVAGHGSRAAVEELISRGTFDTEDRAWFDALLELLRAPVAAVPPPVATRKPLEEAQAAYMRGEAELALLLAEPALPSSERAFLLILCAGALDTLESQNLARRAWSDLPEGERAELAGRLPLKAFLPKVIGSPVEPAPPALPTSWTEWAECLQHEPAWPEARLAAQKGRARWRLEFQDEAALERFVAALSSIPAESEETLKDSLPHLLAAATTDPVFPRQDSRRAYLHILMLVGLYPPGSVSDLDAFVDLAAGVLQLDPDKNTYMDLVGAGIEVLAKGQHAPALVDGALELAELLAYYPPGDAGARVQLLEQVATALRKGASFVSADVWPRFLLVARSCGIEETYTGLIAKERPVAAAEAQRTLAHHLDGLFLGVYTIKAPLAAQVKPYFEQICADEKKTVKVQVNKEKDGSPILIALSVKADIMVVTLRLSSHAATICIDQNRPRDKPLLRVQGRGGISSIRRELEKHFGIADS